MSCLQEIYIVRELSAEMLELGSEGGLRRMRKRRKWGKVAGGMSCNPIGVEFFKISVET